MGHVRGSDGAGVGPASPGPSDAAGDPYGGPASVIVSSGRRTGKTAAQEVIAMAFDGAYVGPLVMVEMINGSPCVTVNGQPKVWMERWLRA